jgi:hypothetical protein
MVAISRKLRALRRRSRRGGARCSALKSDVDCKANAECKWDAKLSKCKKAAAAKRVDLDCRTSDDCNQAKFIEIENDTIIQGVDEGTMNKNLNYKDKNYFKLVNQYNAIKQGVNVGDILYINAGEQPYSCFLALRGKVQWLGDDGDTPDFMLNLLKYKPILDKHNVKYGKLFRNQEYYVFKNENKLKHIPASNPLVSQYLLGRAVETTMPAEILNGLAEGGIHV